LRMEQLISSFVTHLRVDKQIVPLLSKSTYSRSFASAIRELVSNAYDADALTVRISIDRSLTKIEIEDDGNGMTREEFDYYCTIAGQRRDVQYSRKYRRRRIGQFGIGFLSVFPFCEFLQVTTSVENSEEIVTAKIPAKRYFENGSDKDVSQLPIEGSILKDTAARTKHFTRLSLLNPTHAISQYFTRPKTRDRKTIKRWDPIGRFKWELQEDLPIAYKSTSQMARLLKYDEPIGITVFLNDEQLHRNEIGKEILSHGAVRAGNVEYQYAITTDYDAIVPVEARGIKIRMNNVGVGRRTDFELKRSRGFSRLHWLSGEVLISEGLKESLNINRDNFVYAPQVETFLESVSQTLREQAYYVEDIAEAEKRIREINLGSRKRSVGPREEALLEGINRLEKRGFKIVSEDLPSSRPMVSVDKRSKTVTISNVKALSQDEIFVAGSRYELRYAKWDYTKSSNPSCRFEGDQTIELNLNYPLFQSAQYGEIFKRVHVMLLVLQKKYESSGDLVTAMLRDFLNEFKEFGRG
jgi:hypothetical protein